MKLSVLQLLIAKPVFEKLCGQDLPFPAAFRIGRLVDQLRPELVNAAKVHLAVHEQYGTREGDVVSVPPERLAEFQDALKPVLDVEVEAAFESLPLSALNEARLTPIEASALFPFVDKVVNAG